MLKLLIFRGVAGEWVVVLGVLFFVLLVELGKGEHRRMYSLCVFEGVTLYIPVNPTWFGVVLKK